MNDQKFTNQNSFKTDDLGFKSLVKNLIIKHQYFFSFHVIFFLELATTTQNRQSGDYEKWQGTREEAARFLRKRKSN